MSDLEFAWATLGTLGGSGALLALAGLIIIWAKRRRCSLCTGKTTGTIVKHRYLGNGNMHPVVEYTVDGTSYKVTKDFRGIRTKSVTGLPNRIQASAWEDEKGWLNVNRGSFVSYGKLAEELWPIGSETTVYYDPKKPKRSYVERPVTVGFESILPIWMGLGFLALGLLVFVLSTSCVS